VIGMHEHTTISHRDDAPLRRGGGEDTTIPPPQQHQIEALPGRSTPATSPVTRFVMRPDATTSRTRGTREGVQREAEEQEEGGGGATRGSGVMRGVGAGRDVAAGLRDGGATRHIIPANKKLRVKSSFLF
jgi:hypothetical protein